MEIPGWEESVKNRLEALKLELPLAGVPRAWGRGFGSPGNADFPDGAESSAFFEATLPAGVDRHQRYNLVPADQPIK